MKIVAYEVTPTGCWNCISHAIGINGYPMKLYQGKCMNMHRYIYLTQVGPIPEGILVRHKCDNRKCINPDHLELGTIADNAHDRTIRNRGASHVGGKNGKAKLSEEDVRKILKRYENGERPSHIARDYKVTNECIYNIVHKKSWKHITHTGGEIL